MPPPVVDGETIVFRFTDTEQARTQVRLWCDLDLPETTFVRTADEWQLRIERPPVDRLEYLLDLDGEFLVDPGNPLVVPGAFGDHSWLPLPGYAAPAWLEVEPVPHQITTIADDLAVWSPADSRAGEALPLLLAHDGPEMAAYGQVDHYVGAMIAVGRLPRLRLALLAPGERNSRYSANPAYADTLTRELVPLLRRVCPTDGPLVLMGQSLGAVAALHAAWTHPGTFGGLFLQSGSFFTPELDPQEASFEHWAAVTGFVARVHAAGSAGRDFPRASLVCGSAEENYANNRLMAEQLTRIGTGVRWGEVRDGHTWTCWRDLLDPYLTDLLGQVWA